MTITFSSKAWENYLFWQKTDKAMLKTDLNNLPQ